MAKVLYVEDHLAQRDILAQMLELNGFEVDVANNGLEGVEKARTWLPDIILMDLKMPIMDGVEAIQVLRSDETTSHIPIVAISAWASAKPKERALAAGANKHYTKPVDFNRLLASIKRYVEDASSISSKTTHERNDYKESLAYQAKNPKQEKKQRTSQEVLIFHNPYIAGPPITEPSMFFGHQSNLAKIINSLINNFILLTGPRRIGKTSLLYQLAYRLSQSKNVSEQNIPVLINIEGVSENEFFHLIMEEVVDTIQAYLPGMNLELSFDLLQPNYSARIFSRDLYIILKSVESVIAEPLQSTFSEKSQNASTKSFRLVLLIDEMDTLSGFSLEIQSQLRRIFQRFANRNLSVVVAGVKLRQHWAGESSPFYNMFMPVELKPFSDEEARRLIIEPDKDAYTYTDAAIDHIIETTSRLPHRIQQLCLETLHYVQTNFQNRTKITEQDVNNVLQTIRWLDEEEEESRDKFGTPTIIASSPIIAEEKIHYQPSNSEPEE